MLTKILSFSFILALFYINPLFASLGECEGDFCKACGQRLTGTKATSLDEIVRLKRAEGRPKVFKLKLFVGHDKKAKRPLTEEEILSATKQRSDYTHLEIKGKLRPADEDGHTDPTLDPEVLKKLLALLPQLESLKFDRMNNGLELVRAMKGLCPNLKVLSIRRSYGLRMHTIHSKMQEEKRVGKTREVNIMEIVSPGLVDTLKDGTLPDSLSLLDICAAGSRIRDFDAPEKRCGILKEIGLIRPTLNVLTMPLAGYSISDTLVPAEQTDLSGLVSLVEDVYKWHGKIDKRGKQVYHGGDVDLIHCQTIPAETVVALSKEYSTLKWILHVDKDRWVYENGKRQDDKW